MSHLSKGTEDLKLKCKKLPTFLGRVFHALSHGVIHFVSVTCECYLKSEVFDTTFFDTDTILILSRSEKLIPILILIL